MASIYACNVIGTGTRKDSFRAQVADIATHTTIMIDDRPGFMKALVFSPVDGLESNPGINLLVSAASRQALITSAGATIPAGKRLTINAWLTAAGYPALSARWTTWGQAIVGAARFVNSAADLSLGGVG